MLFVTNARKGTFRESLQRKSNQIQRAIYSFPLASNTAFTGIPESLTKSSATVEINTEWKVKALFDSGSSESFIHPSLVETSAIRMHPSSRTVSMASSVFPTKVTGYCIVNLTSQGWVYEGLHLSVPPGLSADLILGLYFQSQHESVTFNYGSKPSLSIFSLH